MFENLGFLTDYAGVIAGFVILVAASFLLPRKARTYVLTGGLAIIAFRTFQIFTNRKKLQAADAERERLRTEAKRLDNELDDIREQHASLRSRLSEEQQNLEELRRERAALDERAAATVDEVEALNAKTEAALSGIEDLKHQLTTEQHKMDAAAALWRSYEP
jgi:chromosome segregation ATPase